MLVQSQSDISAKEKCMEIYKAMLTCRYIDDKMFKLVRQNKGGTFYLSSNGHEMIGAIAALSLEQGKDWGLPYYRDRAFAIGLGSDPMELLASLMARSIDNHSGGRMMPEHFSHKDNKIPCQSSVVGSQFLHAVGVAKGIQFRKTDEVVYVSAGDGATSQGDFHEALNFASIHKLPVVFVIQNNDIAISVKSHEQTAGSSVSKLFDRYPGIEHFSIDGCDFEEVSKTIASAYARARAQEGPSLVVANVPRLQAHSNSDDPKKYLKDEEIENIQSLDPIPRFEKWMLDMGLISSDEIVQIKDQIFSEIEKASLEAEKIPFPSKDTILDHIFKPHHVQESDSSDGNDSIVIVDAINKAIDEEMSRDEGVVTFGQDVAHGKGGVFGVTRGLSEKYGNRCFNTPLAESTIVGIAIGMSFDGVHKPVAEVQFSDYIWTGMNQLINELSSIHYRSNGEWNCPVVIRMPSGGYIQGGPYHSQSIEGYLAHCPGLKIVMPSNSSDAKRLMKSAIS